MQRCSRKMQINTDCMADHYITVSDCIKEGLCSLNGVRCHSLSSGINALIPVF